MFQYGECGLFKLGNQAYCRIDVEQIVVGNLFAVKLCEHLVEIAEEVAALMGILAITHSLGSVDCYAKCRWTVFLVKVIEDGTVVA